MLPQTGRAATITVTSTADTGPGTLRAALAAAGNSDVINFAIAFPATITLTTGELTVGADVTVAGPGAANLTVSANNGSRVFRVGPGNTATISGLTISSGLVSAGGVGAGIYLENTTLALINCVLRSNHASGGTTAHGGGIYVAQSQLTMVGCTLDSNVATGNGGGIYNSGSTLTIDRSTITANSAVNGGGVYNAVGTVMVTKSLFGANAATRGGGIANVGSIGTAGLTVNNCTFASNTVSGASATGSQIHNARQFAATSAVISNCTLLSNNVAPTYSGGAVYTENGGSVTLGNTIIQTSLQEHSIVSVGATSSVTSAGYNLSFDNGNGFLSGPNDQISTDPLLDIGTGPRDNGGPTFTIALQANSPAIDKGKVLSATSDQRGEPRPFNDPNVGNAAGGDGSDIGAYEADLRLINFARMTNDLQLTFTTIVGKNYQLQSVSSLVAGNWGSFGSIVPGNGGVLSLPATGAFTQPSPKFFRALQTP
ncbi:MAG TPA: choice-of-anchor Q domain-containing protein [Chthoniobacterales bacterium]|nr:choice-of-anchor Q domain-containing protein [Chthoniobacterales bacterium]